MRLEYAIFRTVNQLAPFTGIEPQINSAEGVSGIKTALESRFRPQNQRTSWTITQILTNMGDVVARSISNCLSRLAQGNNCYVVFGPAPIPP